MKTCKNSTLFISFLSMLNSQYMYIFFLIEKTPNNDVLVEMAKINLLVPSDSDVFIMSTCLGTKAVNSKSDNF